MTSFIALTHLGVKGKPAPVQVNVDQICRIGDSSLGAPGYPTEVLLAQGQVYVQESVAQVMQIINGSNPPAMVTAAGLAAMATGAAAKPKLVAEAGGKHPRRRSKRK